MNSELEDSWGALTPIPFSRPSDPFGPKASMSSLLSTPKVCFSVRFMHFNMVRTALFLTGRGLARYEDRRLSSSERSKYGFLGKWGVGSRERVRGSAVGQRTEALRGDVQEDGIVFNVHCLQNNSQGQVLLTR